MLYQLFIAFRDDLRGGPLEFLRVVTFPEFAALLAALVAFGIVTLSGNRMIRWLLRRKIGDAADFDDEQLNEASKNKKNTPTMGGLLVVGAIIAATVLVADIASFYVQMAVVCLLWLGGVGAVDDWLKLNAARRQTGRQGLLSREKLLLQVGLASVLAMFLWRYAGQLDAASQLYVPFFKNVAIPLSAWVFVPLTVVVIVGSSNAVNLTDGLDGLAAGCVVMVALVLLVLSIIIGDARLSDFLLFHHLPQVAPLAVVCGATVGSALGFLWFNCNPARV
ncbi:MAG: phospho-N-acetylmuramoyl-pentapeptide-transferase, partial [Planctomycetota bacterium]